MWLTEHMVAFIGQAGAGQHPVHLPGAADRRPSPGRRGAAGMRFGSVRIDYVNFPTLQALWAEVQRRDLDVSPQPTWGKLGGRAAGHRSWSQLSFTPSSRLSNDISPLARRGPMILCTSSDSRFSLAAWRQATPIQNLMPLVQANDSSSKARLRLARRGPPHGRRTNILALITVCHLTGDWASALDRLTMLLTDQTSIREVNPLPHAATVRLTRDRPFFGHCSVECLYKTGPGRPGAELGDLGLATGRQGGTARSLTRLDLR